MRRTTGLTLVGASIAAVLALAVAPIFSSTDEGAPQATEVVMFRCNLDDSGFGVSAYQGSAATPAKRSNDCPEVLARLLREGYQVGNAMQSQVDSNFVVYTLLR